MRWSKPTIMSLSSSKATLRRCVCFLTSALKHVNKKKSMGFLICRLIAEVSINQRSFTVESQSCASMLESKHTRCEQPKEDTVFVTQIRSSRHKQQLVNSV